jgi:hypothetical protein
MGQRLTRNLGASGYAMRYVEISETRKAALAEAGITTVPLQSALDGTHAVILAVPDNRIGQVAHQLAHHLSAGTMIMVLDAAAPYAGELPTRDDLIYFVTHPCHPPVFSEEANPDAQRDFFGGEHAKQHIVCALMQGRKPPTQGRAAGTNHFPARDAFPSLHSGAEMIP